MCTRGRIWLLGGALFLLLFTPGYALPAAAATYTWTDAQGGVHFQDTPPQSLAAGTKLTTLPDISSDSGTGSATDAAGESASAPAAQVASPHQVKVEVYGTSWCPWCKKTLAYFRSRGIAVQDYDVQNDPAAAERKQKLDPGNGIPTTVINGQVINGYEPAAFAAALKQAR